MSGPWERWQQPAEAGPWTRYQSQKAPQPGQEFVSAPTPGARVSPTTGVADSPGGSAGFLTTLRASLAPAEGDQIDRYAAARFPNMPPDQARRRYGVVDGNIVYMDDSGQMVREIPSVFGGSLAEIPQRLGQNMGAMAGPTIPAVAGIAGGMASAPFMGGVPGATAAAGAADAARQSLDRALAGQDPTNIDPLNVAGQALLGGAGQLAGLGMARGAQALFERNALGVGAADRVRAMAPGAQQGAIDLSNTARSMNSFVTPGEATNLPSLLNIEDAARATPEGQRLTEALQRRNAQDVPRIAREGIAGLPGRAGLPAGESAMQGLTKGAGGTLEWFKNSAQQAVRPYYEEAYSSGVEPDISGVIRYIDDRLASGEAPRGTPAYDALTAARGKLIEKTEPVIGPDGKPTGEMREVPWRNYKSLHSIKEALNAAWTPPPLMDKSAASRARRELTGATQELTRVLSEAHPSYNQGREMFRELMQPIGELAEGGVGAVSKQEGAGVVSRADALFSAGKSTPEAVRTARQAFERAGHLSEFDDGLKAWLHDQLLDAMRVNAGGQPGNIAGKFQKATWGDERQRAIVIEAMGGLDNAAAVDGFGKMMGVLEAMAKSLPEGSRTAVRGQTLANSRMDLAPAMRTALNFFSPQAWGQTGARVVEDRAFNRYWSDVVERTLRPDSIEDLKRLRMLSPTSREAINITSRILGRAGLEAAPGFSQPDRPPAAAVK